MYQELVAVNWTIDGDMQSQKFKHSSLSSKLVSNCDLRRRGRRVAVENDIFSLLSMVEVCVRQLWFTTHVCSTVLDSGRVFGIMQRFRK